MADLGPARREKEGRKGTVAFAGGFRQPEEIGSGGPSYGEMFRNDPEIFRAQHPQTLARANAYKIRGKLAISMYVGNKDQGIVNNRRMHATLEELRIPCSYQEFDGIAHNLRLLSENLKEENFAFAARSFKLPRSK